MSSNHYSGGRDTADSFADTSRQPSTSRQHLVIQNNSNSIPVLTMPELDLDPLVVSLRAKSSNGTMPVYKFDNTYEEEEEEEEEDLLELPESERQQMQHLTSFIDAACRRADKHAPKSPLGK